MAARGTAVVPTLVNVENFPGFAAAGEKKFPAYASTMRRLYANSGAVVRAAYEAGVPVFAGTDAGGGIAHGRDRGRGPGAARRRPAGRGGAGRGVLGGAELAGPALHRGGRAGRPRRLRQRSARRPRRATATAATPAPRTTRRLTRAGRARGPRSCRPATSRSAALPPELSAVRRAMSRPRPVEPAPLLPALDGGGRRARARVGDVDLGAAAAPAGARPRRTPVPSGVCAKTLPSRASTAAPRSAGGDAHRQRPPARSTVTARCSSSASTDQNRTRSPTTAVGVAPGAQPLADAPPGLGDHLVDAAADGVDVVQQPLPVARPGAPRRPAGARSAACAAGARGRRRSPARRPAARRSGRPAGSPPSRPRAPPAVRPGSRGRPGRRCRAGAPSRPGR